MTMRSDKPFLSSKTESKRSKQMMIGRTLSPKNGTKLHNLKMVEDNQKREQPLLHEIKHTSKEVSIHTVSTYLLPILNP